MRITRWGNSLAVRIPKALAEQTALREGSEIELSFTGGALTVRPKARAYSLEQLLDQVTPENRHDEIDWATRRARKSGERRRRAGRAVMSCGCPSRHWPVVSRLGDDRLRS